MTRTLAIFLLIGACNASWSAQESKGLSDPSPSKENQLANDSARQQYPTEQSPLPIRVIDGPSDSAHTKEREAKSDKHEAADLDAQIRTANASEEQVRIAWSALFLSTIGAFFVGWTIFETRRSAMAAIRAANAAEAAVDVASETARRQLRAYVSVYGAQLDFPSPGVPLAKVTIKNTGQTPAHSLKFWIHQWIEVFPLNVELPLPQQDFVMSHDVLGTGGVLTNELASPKMIVKDAKDVGIIGTKGGTIYVYGEVTYNDVFGDAHYTKYRLMYGGSRKPSGRGLTVCQDGNEAT